MDNEKACWQLPFRTKSLRIFTDDTSVLAEMLGVTIRAVEVMQKETAHCDREINWEKTKIQKTAELPNAAVQACGWALSGSVRDLCLYLGSQIRRSGVAWWRPNDALLYNL